MRRCLAALAVVLSFSGCATTGIVVGPDFGPSSQAAKSLGAHLVRVEFEIGSSCASMQPALAAYDSVGARVLVLAGFEGRIPSVAEAQSLGGWASCFGPGSTWAKTHQPVTEIEFGNETSYEYQANCPEAHAGQGDWWASSCYSFLSAAYGLRAHQAKAGLTNGVKLLVQADDGGSGNPAWVNGLAAGGLVSSDVGGWTVHPYGSTPQTKLGRVLDYTAAAGFANTIAVDPTEYGISSQECGGAPVFMAGDSQGWGNQLTYAQAASDLNAGLDAIRSFLGSRLGAIFIFAAKDGVPACSSTNRDSFFGSLTSTLGEKGRYSTEVRDQLTR